MDLSIIGASNDASSSAATTPISLHTVEAVSWDITMGAAGTALGQMFLRK